MTPKEKAEELVDKFYKTTPNESYVNDLIVLGYEWKQAKECALIAVDEIFEFMKMDDEHHEDLHMCNSHWVHYWSEVKQEIEKL